MTILLMNKLNNFFFVNTC